MMIRERLDDGVVLSGQAPCLGEQAVGAMRWNCLLVDLGDMVAS
jgi:hypothetical protein